VIIPPAGVLNFIDQYTLYATTSGAVISVHMPFMLGRPRGKEWSSALPIIPWLRPIWSLPDAMRACLTEPVDVAETTAEAEAAEDPGF
jgi:hypothetical protein